MSQEHQTQTDQLAQQMARLQNDLLADRKAARIWGLARIGLFFFAPVFMVLVLAALTSSRSDELTPPTPVAVVRMEGAIGPGEAINSFDYNPALVKAFKDPSSKVVVLAINSPGGTPVQSSLLHDRLLKLKKEHEKELIVVASDTLASGAYFIAAAADKIIVNRSTVVGSIGVVSQQMGLVELLSRIGVEPRITTAGESKARLNPFQPMTDGDRAKLASMLEEIHAHFIDAVKQGRGDRLTLPDDLVFTGDVWTGDQAVTIGLADELGDLHDVLVAYDTATFVDYTPQKSPLDGLVRNLLGATAQWAELKWSTATVSLEAR